MYPMNKFLFVTSVQKARVKKIRRNTFLIKVDIQVNNSGWEPDARGVI